jgi:glycogen debranching enzyme
MTARFRTRFHNPPGLVDWFKQFPYGFASADATPLYAIATGEYVRASGDVAFAREQAPRLWKALAFMRSTLDAAGFPRNLHVGHGWVEGGPLLPVDVEFYQAGCYVEALRSLAMLARAVGDQPRAGEIAAEFETKRRALEDRFWLPPSHAYAFALDTSGQPVDQPSVLATVPMWFGLPDRQHAQEMIGRLAEEPHSTDWGMRIISSHSPRYDPSGYHFGSVWPLFTGWAAVGEYRYHAAEPALANLRANAWLALDGAGGNTTEVLSGDSYSPLSTASPHQIWSAAMVVSPLLRGLRTPRRMPGNPRPRRHSPHRSRRHPDPRLHARRHAGHRQRPQPARSLGRTPRPHHPRPTPTISSCAPATN